MCIARVRSGFSVLLFSYLIFMVSPLQGEKNFTVSTIPKTGTHFIEAFLENLTGKKALFANPFALEPYSYVRSEEKFNEYIQNINKLPIHWFCSPISVEVVSQKLDFLESRNRFLSAHAPFSRQYNELLCSKDYVNFFVIRDPRDYTVSLMNHLINFGTAMFPRRVRFFLFENQLSCMIKGTDWYNRARYVFDVFLRWRSSSITCCLQFEKLVGPLKGNCTAKEHLQELRKIADTLELAVEDNELLEAFNKAFGVGYTYTASKSGSWSDIYMDEHKELMKEYMGDLLIELGYEEGYDW